GENRIFGEQLGPTRSARAMAIVHIAIFDAILSIEPKYTQYLATPEAPKGASMKAAVAQAAHDTLIQLYPSQSTRFSRALEEDLSHVQDVQARDDGILIGQLAAAQIIAER